MEPDTPSCPICNKKMSFLFDHCQVCKRKICGGCFDAEEGRHYFKTCKECKKKDN